MKSKILIIGPTPPPYHGVAVSTKSILDSSVFQKFEILHLDTSDRRSIENIGAFELGNILLGILHAMQFQILLFRHHPELVYLPISQGIGGYLRDLTFLIPCRWFKIATIVHLRGSEFATFYKKRHRVMQFLIRYSLGNVKRLIVLGENLRDMFEELIPLERVVVIPNGTKDVALNSPVSKGSTPIFRGLFLGNLIPRKGFYITLEAVKKALSRFSNLEFSFAGDWPSQKVRNFALRQLQESSFNGRLRFLGVVTGDEKNRLLLESDFFIFPPVQPEGHPRVILEAMAAGLPLITTKQGAIVETVLEGETGYFVEPNNVDALVERIGYWMENPDAMHKMGQAARQRYLEHYTDRISNQKLSILFAEVLEERRHS